MTRGLWHNSLTASVILFACVVNSAEADPLRMVARCGDPAPGGGGNFRNFGQLNGVDPAISGRNIAFGALAENAAGIYLYINGEFRVVADTQTPFPDRNENFGFALSYGSSPSISGENVAFLARSLAEGDSIWAQINGKLIKIADRSTPIPGGTGTFNSFGGLDGVSPSISGENVAFLAADTDQRDGIYAYINGKLIKIADQGTVVPSAPVPTIRFSGFGIRRGVSPSISGENVAFLGGWGSHSGVYAYINGTLRLIADTFTPYPPGTDPFCGETIGTLRISLGASASIDGDNIAFSTGCALLAHNDGVLRVVASGITPFSVTGELLSGFPVSPQMNGGNIVFGAGAEGIGGAGGIFTYRGGSFSLLASSRTKVPRFDTTFGHFFIFDGFQGEDVKPAISGENVVFTATPNGVYAYFPPLHGDVDDNDCLDLFDMAAFQRCLGATAMPGGLPDSCVSVFDFDGNSTVNLNDHAAFVTEMTEGR